ncbi:MAG: class I SAM-dependent methyltransferase [Nitrospirota bacterium]
MRETVKQIGKKLFSPKRYKAIVGLLTKWPPRGTIRFGSFRKTTPTSRVFGMDRGLPIDRYYIEKFLMQHSVDVCGSVLEFRDNEYTERFGCDKVTKSNIICKIKENPRATIIADICDAPHLSSNAYDCIIATSVIQYIYDIRSALAALHRSLKPGGVLLATLPCIAQVSLEDMRLYGEYWRFTDASARLFFEEQFLPANVSLTLYGNVLASISFLHGLSAEELKSSELDHFDYQYQMVIGVKAVKQPPLNSDFTH